jgi:hypothetical protein
VSAPSSIFYSIINYYRIARITAFKQNNKAMIKIF